LHKTLRFIYTLEPVYSPTISERSGLKDHVICLFVKQRTVDKLNNRMKAKKIPTKYVRNGLTVEERQIT